MTIRSKYQSLSEFYAADPRRASSGEADYGCWWMADSPWPKFRVSYVRATGEVYALKLGDRPLGDRPGEGRVEVLGVVPPDKGEHYYATLDRILDTWAEHCGSDLHGLSWVQERLALYGFAAGQKGER